MKEQKWISLSDRLPEKGVASLLYFSSGEIMVGIREKEPGLMWTMYYHTNDLTYWTELAPKLTHWMPLPGEPGSESKTGDSESKP